MCINVIIVIGLLMSLPEGVESLQNNIAQLCELWYVKITCMPLIQVGLHIIYRDFNSCCLLEKSPSVTEFLSLTLLGESFLVDFLRKHHGKPSLLLLP